MPTQTDLRLLLRSPVDFEMGDSPSESSFVFKAADGEHRVTASEAIGALSQGIRTMNAHPSARAWATPAILALRIMARGHLASLDASERSRLQDASRSVDRDPAVAQAKVRAFIDALAVDAPAVASIPQRPDDDAPPVVEMKPRRARTFSGRFVVRFREDPTDDLVADVTLRVRPTDASWGAADAADLWARDDHHFGPGSRQAVRTMLASAATVWSPAARILADPDPGLLPVTTDELALLGSSRIITLLLGHRIDVDWPDELVRDIDARGSVRRVGAPLPDQPRAFSRDQLFRFDWRLAIGDDTLTEAEVDELAKSQHGLLRLRDQWVLVDPSRLRHVLDRRSRDLTPIEAMRAAVSGTVDIDGVTTDVDTVGWLDDLRVRLSERGERTTVPQPATLDGTLRDYQLDGLRWMAQLVELGLGGVLADDMGLGKTVMLIALHLHRVETGLDAPTLVVCPASVLGNWEREIRRFAPTADVRRYHGPGRSLDGVKHGFVVTTYATMRRDAEQIGAHEPGWGLVVADEAQNVKNVRAGAARALRTIPGEAKLALTGTPVENNLAELWAIVDWTTPGLLGSYDSFRQRWSRPIESRRDTGRASDLALLIRPFVLRRRKSDPGIAPELPPKTETDYRVNLTREQVGLYEAVVRETLAEIESARGMLRRGLVVKLLTQLKQICNHPAQFLRTPHERLGGRSGKLGLLDELVEEIVAEGGGILLFTQYAKMGHLLSRHLHERHIDNQFLHGGTHVRTRETMVQRFQRGDVPVFVLSLKAAGTGLNLTRADHVIHFDRWWNPAVEDQATDRAHRIGQTKPVQVHRLISEGTIEESIAELITSKRSLADAVVNAGEGALTELSDAELAQLVRLRK